MNCEEFEELSGAYAIGALSDDERLAADAHLATCDKHPDVAALVAAANSLALAPPQMDPPERLKSRLMDAILAETEQETPAHAASSGRGLLDAIGGWFGAPRFGYGLAAAMTVLVVGLLAWNVSLQSGDDGGTLVAEMTGQVNGQFVYAESQKVAFLELHGLDQLPPDKVYEVWAISDGQALALGVITPSNGEGKAAMEFDGTKYDTIAVTIEQAPGVDQPTTDPITSGKL